jgi:hypothetical protein
MDRKVLPVHGQPLEFTIVIAVLSQGAGGHFFFACKNRLIMPTIKMPIWIRSEYVTIGQPSFLSIGGQEAALFCGGLTAAFRQHRMPKDIRLKYTGFSVQRLAFFR